MTGFKGEGPSSKDTGIEQPDQVKKEGTVENQRAVESLIKIHEAVRNEIDHGEEQRILTIRADTVRNFNDDVKKVQAENIDLSNLEATLGVSNIDVYLESFRREALIADAEGTASFLKKAIESGNSQGIGSWYHKTKEKLLAAQNVIPPDKKEAIQKVLEQAEEIAGLIKK